MAPKAALLRYVAPDGVVRADPEGKLPGRGAYTCRTSECFETARARGGFPRAFRRTVKITEENVHLDDE